MARPRRLFGLGPHPFGVAVAGASDLRRHGRLVERIIIFWTFSSYCPALKKASHYGEAL